VGVVCLIVALTGARGLATSAQGSVTLVLASGSGNPLPRNPEYTTIEAYSYTRGKGVGEGPKNTEKVYSAALTSPRLIVVVQSQSLYRDVGPNGEANSLSVRPFGTLPSSQSSGLWNSFFLIERSSRIELN